jgi:hypothetical protein
MVQERQGKGKFLTFYRYFLLRLFHEGFSQQPTQRAADLEELLSSWTKEFIHFMILVLMATPNSKPLLAATFSNKPR